MIAREAFKKTRRQVDIDMNVDLVFKNLINTKVFTNQNACGSEF